MEALQIFPGTENPEDFKVFASLDLQSEAMHVRFRVHGPINALLLPPLVANPQYREGLWQHTCFEMFLQVEGETSYEEWNLSPAGHWAYFAFQDYRQRVEGDLKLEPLKPLSYLNNDFQWQIVAELPLYHSFVQRSLSLQYGLCCILELKSGEKQYWSLVHAGERPDFHRPDSFQGKLRLRG